MLLYSTLYNVEICNPVQHVEDSKYSWKQFPTSCIQTDNKSLVLIILSSFSPIDDIFSIVV